MEQQFNLELDSNGMVSSIDIHGFLGINEKYATWIKRWVGNLNVKEGQNFVRQTKQSTGGRPSIDFLVNEHFAITLVMVSKGKFSEQLRDYLISLFNKRRDLELITPEEAVFANKIIRCLRYIEYQKEAKEIHQKHYMQGRTPYDFLYAQFNNYRNNIIGIDKKEIERLVNEYILKNEHPVKAKSIIGKINEIDPSEALRIACMDLLLGNSTDLDTANKFASLVKKMAKLDNIQTLKKNETNLFQTKDENSDIKIMQNEVKAISQ